MKKLKFCPKCGKEKLQWDNHKKWHCSNCDYTYYHNCAAAVAVVLSFEEKIFFSVRNQEPKRGMLDLPGGFVDPNETAEEACQRELLEELGWKLDLDKLKYLSSHANTYCYKEINYQTLDLFYVYKLSSIPQFNLDYTELKSGVWLDAKNLKHEDLAFDSQKQFLEKIEFYLDKTN